MCHDRNSISERRARLVADLYPKDSLEQQAFRQFKLDYAAAGEPDKRLRATPFLPTNDSPSLALVSPATEDSAPMYFEVLLADRVRLTSTRFSGGDWYWRFCTAEGVAVAHCGGYRSEADCLSAIETIQRAAGSALVCQR